MFVHFFRQHWIACRKFLFKWVTNTVYHRHTFNLVCVQWNILQRLFYFDHLSRCNTRRTKQKLQIVKGEGGGVTKKYKVSFLWNKGGNNYDAGQETVDEGSRELTLCLPRPKSLCLHSSAHTCIVWAKQSVV